MALLDIVLSELNDLNPHHHGIQVLPEFLDLCHHVLDGLKVLFAKFLDYPRPQSERYGQDHHYNVV